MVRSSVMRLLRAFVPFCLMVLIQRGLLLLFGYLRLSSRVADLLAFIPAALCCAVAFFLIRVLPAESEGEDEIPPLTKKGLACSILQTAVAVAVMAAMMYAVSSIMDDFLADEVTLSVLTVASTLIIHPILEEYVFRGLIYTEMRRMNPIFATLAQAVMFAIVHNTVSGMLYALASGVVLAALFEVSGRLWTSIAAHIIINARSLVYMTLLAPQPELIRVFDTMLFVLGVISLIGLFVIRGFAEGSDDTDTAANDAEVEDDEE